MEISELERFNSWWKTGKVREELLKDYKRDLFTKLNQYLNKKQMLLIWGLRRTGKTVMMLQLIQQLLERENTDPKHILFFSLDEIVFDIKDVLETYQKEVLNRNFDEVKTAIFIFLDEVQKSSDWENKLKTYYDLYPNVKFILSGSASVQLKKKSAESLAGRLYDFQLKPLSFKEYLELSGVNTNKVKKNYGVWKRTIIPLFYKYLKFGMFPELVGEDNEETAKNYIINNVVDRIIYKDLPEDFGIKDLELLQNIVHLVSKNPGMLVNYSEIASNLGRDKRTIADYFKYLEAGLIIRFSFNYRGSSLASMRKLKKAYLTTPNIAFAFSDAFDTWLPKAIENLAFLILDANFFYRNGFEIDIVLPIGGKITAVEVKRTAVEVKQIEKFKEKFGNKVADAFMIDAEKEGKIGNTGIIPIWKLALDSGFRIKK